MDRGHTEPECLERASTWYKFHIQTDVNNHSVMSGGLPRHNDYFEYQNWNLHTNVSKPNESILVNLPL